MKVTSHLGTLPKSPLLGFAQKGTITKSNKLREPSAEESFIGLCPKRNR